MEMKYDLLNFMSVTNDLAHPVSFNRIGSDRPGYQ